MRRLFPIAFLALAAGCTTPGTGWSRASDLSVYGAMDQYGAIAREHSVLCGGFGTGAVGEAWAEDFGAREAAVTARLTERHGAGDVAAAAASRTLRVPCEELPTLKWRHRYERLLRLLETRLGLA
ncbi:MAG TPA: hypothetical protein VLK25_10155 [Allosphingosinicella sp.]|nr:hypothetical protein [Allosphingosinicella sp.]